MFFCNLYPPPTNGFCYLERVRGFESNVQKLDRYSIRLLELQEEQFVTVRAIELGLFILRSRQIRTKPPCLGLENTRIEAKY